MLRVFGLPFQLAKRTTKSTINLTKEGIDISKYSVDFTKQSDSVDKEFRKKELRAYVSINDLKFGTFLKDKIFKGIISIQNTGKTPAEIMRTVWTFKKNTKKLYETDWDVARKYDTLLGCSLHPGIPRVTEFDEDFKLTVMDSIRIITRISNFFIYGFIFYDDVFGEHHETRYVFIYDPDRKDFYLPDIKEPEK